MVKKYTVFWIGALLIATMLRWLLPTTRGITMYFGSSTRYIAANVLGFWAVLALSLIIFILIIVRRAGRIGWRSGI